jgi:hypothetical protein
MLCSGPRTIVDLRLVKNRKFEGHVHVRSFQLEKRSSAAGSLSFSGYSFFRTRLQDISEDVVDKFQSCHMLPLFFVD